MGAEIPKALVPVAGESLLRRAVRGLLESRRVQHVVVAAPADGVDTVAAEVALFGAAVHVVPGGGERTDSVRRALSAIERICPEAEVVLVHDAARAFTPPSVIRAVVDEVVRGAPAVVPVLPLSDTVKEIDADSGEVVATADRSRLRAVQTPQGFSKGVLKAAYAAGGELATDDAGLVERIGQPVRTVPGHAHALKITTAFDLTVAEALLTRPDAADADQPLATGRESEAERT